MKEELKLLLHSAKYEQNDLDEIADKILQLFKSTAEDLKNDLPIKIANAELKAEVISCKESLERQLQLEINLIKEIVKLKKQLDDADEWEKSAILGYEEWHKVSDLYPEELVNIPIKAACPKEICVTCGKPKMRKFKSGEIIQSGGAAKWDEAVDRGEKRDKIFQREVLPDGWTDCDCGSEYVPGVALDPFMGSRT